MRGVRRVGCRHLFLVRNDPPSAKAAHAAAAPIAQRPPSPWRMDEAWLQREWLLVDGHGGFACGTLADLPTRRYHGWLCAWPAGAERRQHYLARCDERLLLDDGEQSLLAARWQDGTLQAPAAAIGFEGWPLPTWRLELHGVRLRRQLAMPGVPGAVLVAYANEGDRPLRLRLRPLLTLRVADYLRHGQAAIDTAVRPAGVRWQPPGPLPPLWLSGQDLDYRDEPLLYRGIDYARDDWRGYDHVEDLCSPGVVQFELQPGEERVLAFAVGEPLADPAAQLAAVRRRRQARIDALAARHAGRELQLAVGADDFFYAAPGDRPGILAGFPWFVEWGRDVFVALPGLTLARGELRRCEAVLAGALPFLHDGMLPNVYGATPAASHYGSADAALWFALAVRRWQQASGRDAALQRRLMAALRQIADACRRGTALGIRLRDDGLLEAGGERLNATWMDAQTAQGPVTPRHGCAVEINALWYSLLSQLAEPGGEFEPLRRRCGEAFVRRFWLPDQGHLADCWRDGEVDRSVRPNMVIAAALEHSPLERAQRQAVVDTASRELLTPRGLRTLSPRATGYRGRYDGGCEGRDQAYHQGTAWPWLCGFYTEAALRAAAPAQRPALAARLSAQLATLLEGLDEAGVGHLSEVYDGDAPQRPEGSFAQAWNSGEVLRALQLCRDGLP